MPKILIVLFFLVFITNTVFSSSGDTDNNKTIKQLITEVKELNKEKKIRQLENAIRARNYNTIERIIMEAQYEYFEYMYHRKFKIKIKSDLRSFLNGEKIENEKIDNPLFIEAYKMYMGTDINKDILGELLTKYLKGEQ